MSAVAKSPQEIAEALCDIGTKKTKLSFQKKLVLGILAGVYIGFGAQLSITVTQDLAKYVGVGLSQLIGGSVFSVGLMLVVVGGAELFTGNNLIVLSCLGRRSSVSGLLTSWTVVYIANFVGSVLLAYLVFQGGLHTMNNGALGIRALTIANAKVNLPFLQAFARGIVCNWLVCLAVWMALSSADVTGKILSCFFPIMAFVASGFEHSVANMYFIPLGLFLKDVPSLVSESGLNLSNLTWTTFMVNNLIPVTIGNLIGGAFFVAATYWYVYLRGTAK